MRQFIEGLGPLWDLAQQNPRETKALFIHDPQPITAADFRKLYDISYSPEGANNRVLEEDTVYCWELFILTFAGITSKYHVCILLMS